jgi:hypothetical protein
LNPYSNPPPNPLGNPLPIIPPPKRCPKPPPKKSSSSSKKLAKGSLPPKNSLNISSAFLKLACEKWNYGPLLPDVLPPYSKNSLPYLSKSDLF